MLCKYYFGSGFGCRAGSSCPFSHVAPSGGSASLSSLGALDGSGGVSAAGIAQQKADVLSAVSRSVSRSEGPATRDEMCRYIERGMKCLAGDDCPFRHSRYDADERGRRERGLRKRERKEAAAAAVAAEVEVAAAKANVKAKEREKKGEEETGNAQETENVVRDVLPLFGNLQVCPTCPVTSDEDGDDIDGGSDLDLANVDWTRPSEADGVESYFYGAAGEKKNDITGREEIGVWGGGGRGSTSLNDTNNASWR